MTEAIVAGAPQGTPPPDLGDKFTFLLAHADDNMVIAQRLGELISWAPDLETDIAIGNTALDHLGIARALYTYAGEVEAKGRTEDDLAMGRNEREYMNLLLVEQPNGDFAHTMIRQFLFDAYQLELWADLAQGNDERLAGIAARGVKEARYHFRNSSGWVVRLGDGTDESHARAQAALDGLWRFTGELFEGDAVRYSDAWRRRVDAMIEEATLGRPIDSYQRSGGRSGFHTEELGFVLAEMQWMQRSYPGLKW